MSLIIDCNVPIIANGKHDAASPECVERCIDSLLSAQAQVVLIDDNYLIFREYRKYLSHGGQPGVGDAFFKWLWDNQANLHCCRQVAITPDEDGDRVFKEFPADADLAGFDRDDRKFVAVALASGEQPWILNGSDSDWWHFREPLERNGVRISFLCMELMP